MSIERIGVIGAGQMGNGIAHVCSLAGFDVVMEDISAEALEQGARHHREEHAPPGSARIHQGRSDRARAEAHRMSQASSTTWPTATS